MPFAEQHARGISLQERIHQRRILGLRQVHQPKIGLGTVQVGRLQARRVVVQHDLIATAGQRLLQHMALQRGVG
ncbi:hypothetical protein OMR07_26265 [Methylobacterium organophilum]|nr:hypothetical protein [Methylobacterium organophilum]